MTENFLIIHGAGCSDDDPNRDETKRNRKPRLENKLKEKGAKVDNPRFPIPGYPNYNDWVNVIKNLNINKNTTIIAHSFGVAFIIRWLGESNIKIKKLICICGTKFVNENKLQDPKRNNCIKNFQQIYDFEISPNLKSNIGKSVFIIGENEKDRTFKSMRLYQEKLGGGKRIEIPGKSHFTKSRDGTTEFPELLEELGL